MAYQRGFKVNWVQLRPIKYGGVFWTGREDYSSSVKEFEIRLPKYILTQDAVQRDMQFSTVEPWNFLRIVHTVLYKGDHFDEQTFEYGSVSAYQIRDWGAIIYRNPGSATMPAELLSGNVVVVTKFYDEELLLATSNSRIFFD